MSQPYVIVWDLDRTLGDFEALHRHGLSADPVRVPVRPQLAEALRTLNEEGFVHTLLTLAPPPSAELILRGTGLREFFVRVEGQGQRGKGDAEGLAEVFGLKRKERPRRMFFVGDQPVIDEPKDHGVVFHLEPCFLSRSAIELARLLLHLRDVGDGSLRQGFDLLANPIRWWQWVIPLSPPMPYGRPVRRTVPEVGQLLLMARKDGCPSILFENPPVPAVEPSEHTFVPAELLAHIEAERGKQGRLTQPSG